MHKYNLRLTQYSTLPAIEIEGNKVKGPLGKRLMSLSRSVYSKANISVVSPTTGQLGADIGNGTFDGLIGLLQNNEADMTLITYSTADGSSFVDASAVTNSAPGVFGHFPKPKHELVTLLESLAIFSLEVYLSTLMTFFFMSLALIVLDYCRLSQLRPIDHLYGTGRCLVSQPDIAWLKGKLRALTFMLLSWALFLTMILNQSMSAENVAFDFSNVVNSIEDMLRLKTYKPILMQNVPITNILKNSTHKTFRDLWKRAEDVGTDYSLRKWNPATLPPVLDENEVLISANVVCEAFMIMYCGRMQDRKAWISQYPYVEHLVSHYLTKHMSRELRNYLDTRVEVAAAAGMYLGGGQFMKKISEELMNGQRRCFKDKMEDLFEDFEIDFTVKLDNTWTTLVYIMVGFGMALLVLLLELVNGLASLYLPSQSLVIKIDKAIDAESENY